MILDILIFLSCRIFFGILTQPPTPPLTLDETSSLTKCKSLYDSAIACDLKSSAAAAHGQPGLRVVAHRGRGEPGVGGGRSPHPRHPRGARSLHLLDERVLVEEDFQRSLL